jgi:hypothetical protein
MTICITGVFGNIERLHGYRINMTFICARNFSNCFHNTSLISNTQYPECPHPKPVLLHPPHSHNPPHLLPPPPHLLTIILLTHLHKLNLRILLLHTPHRRALSKPHRSLPTSLVLWYLSIPRERACRIHGPGHQMRNPQLLMESSQKPEIHIKRCSPSIRRIRLIVRRKTNA